MLLKLLKKNLIVYKKCKNQDLKNLGYFIFQVSKDTLVYSYKTALKMNNLAF